MPQSHRTTARAALLLVAILAMTAGSAAAFSDSVAGKVPSPLVFPVIGAVQYGNDFGAARPQGGHEGNDVMAPMRAIAVATESGKIKFHTTSARAGCMLYLYGDSGATYLYIHLYKGPDNRGNCTPGVAYWHGLKDGTRVEAGEPVGFVGNSGDASGGAPHLHFEIQPDGHNSVNPFRYLNKATRLLFAAKAGSAVTLALTGSVVAVDPETLSMRVEELTVFPIGIRLVKLTRPLTVKLSSATLVDAGASGRDGSGFVLGVSLAGRKVVVLTEPEAATVETMAGKDGVFSAARIAVKK